MSKYALGIDFGSLSVRALLLDMEKGGVKETAVSFYAHGIYDEVFKDEETLPYGYAIQDPEDYVDSLVRAVRGVLQKAEVKGEEVVSVGIDATGSTMLPVLENKKPLSSLKEFAHEPHAFVKMWKHHGALEETKEIQRVIEERNETFLDYYGGTVSSEWFLPKMLETLRKAPKVYETAAYFLEIADWINWILTDQLSRSTCTSGYKMFYQSDRGGYPDPEFFAQLDPRMDHVLENKLSGPVISAGEAAGSLCKEAAEMLGLTEGIKVAAALIDAHASLSGVGVTSPDTLVLVMGTSTCHMLLSEEGKKIPGVAGCVYDGIQKGLYGYETGQSCVGDGFSWFVDNLVPGSYKEEAGEKGVSLHSLLIEKLKGYKAGKSGLLALDWFNGIRSPRADFDLNGMLVGMNLTTKPEEIYLALIEATAYGSRGIMERFEEGGLKIKEVVLTGGIPGKNPLLVKIYANILRRPVHVAQEEYVCAIGAALQGISAAKEEVTGYPGLEAAAAALSSGSSTTVYPEEEEAKVYDILYAEYQNLCQYFGEENDVMKQLNALRKAKV